MKKCSKCGLVCEEQTLPGSGESVVILYVCPDSDCGGYEGRLVVERDGTEHD